MIITSNHEGTPLSNQTEPTTTEKLPLHSFRWDLTVQDYTTVMMVADMISKGPTVDVRAFGAKGDGITDDTAAIQEAINYCIQNKKKLFFPNGVYRCTPILNHKTADPYGGDYALFINGTISMIGESEHDTIFKTTKLDGTLPDGSKNGYVGLIGCKALEDKTQKLYMSNITMDGGNTAVVKTYNRNHKGLCGQWNQGYAFSTFIFDQVTIKNFEGEGAYSAGTVALCEFHNCSFRSSGGSMGNISGDTKYYNCKFTNCTCAIEHANKAYSGSLEVIDCRFYNGCRNGGTVIAVINNHDPFDVTKLVYRTNTKAIIRGCSFTNTKDWIIATAMNSSAYLCSAIGIWEVGTTIVENNVFRNSTLGSIYGNGIVIVGAWNENFKFNNNTIILSDEFFQTHISLNTINNIKVLEITNNNVLCEYPLDRLYNLFSITSSLSIDHFIAFGNKLYTGSKQFFTANYSEYNMFVLVTNKKYSLKVTINILTQSNTELYFCDNNASPLQTIIKSTLAPGKYEYYIDILTPNSTSIFATNFRLKGNGNIANYFTASIIDISM